MLKHFNNGLSFKPMTDDYISQLGEVLFSDYATIEQLQFTFPDYLMTSALAGPNGWTPQSVSKS